MLVGHSPRTFILQLGVRWVRGVYRRLGARRRLCATFEWATDFHRLCASYAGVDSGLLTRLDGCMVSAIVLARILRGRMVGEGLVSRLGAQGLLVYF